MSFSGNRYHGSPEIYGVDDPGLNYSVDQADLGVRFFLGGPLHLTLRGGYSFYRRFEFSSGAEVVETCSAGNGAVLVLEVGGG